MKRENSSNKINIKEIKKLNCQQRVCGSLNHVTFKQHCVYSLNVF